MSLFLRFVFLLFTFSSSAQQKRGRINAILREPVPGPVVQLLAEIGCEGGVDLRINDENFPGMQADASFEDVVAIDLGPVTGTEAVIARLADMGLKPCRADKGLRWIAANPDAHREHALMILGPFCATEAEEFGILARTNDGKRNMGLIQTKNKPYWAGICRFLAEPIVPNRASLPWLRRLLAA